MLYTRIDYLDMMQYLERVKTIPSFYTELLEHFSIVYDVLYGCDGLDYVAVALLECYEEFAKIGGQFWSEILSQLVDERGDAFTSDRELIALFIAIENLSK